MLNMRTNASHVGTSRSRTFASFVAIALVASSIAAGEAPARADTGAHPASSARRCCARPLRRRRARRRRSAGTGTRPSGGLRRCTSTARESTRTSCGRSSAEAAQGREFHSKKTSQVVTGLPNGKKYTFRVAARNSVGSVPSRGRPARFRCVRSRIPRLGARTRLRRRRRRSAGTGNCKERCPPTPA